MAEGGRGVAVGEDGDGDNKTGGFHHFHKILECSICLDVYENPKTLQCSHEYCKRCLEDIAVFQQDGSIVISCPMRCKESTSLAADKTVDNLLGSYIVKNILESYRTQQVKTNDLGSPRCMVVEDCRKEISLFCCDALMCVSCHRKHLEEAGVGVQHRQFNLWYDVRTKKLLVLCQQHSTGCTHLCVDNEFLCVYCLHRNTLHLSHPKNKIELETRLLREALKNESDTQREIELMLANTKQSIDSARKRLQDVLEKRKAECLDRYRLLLEAKELNIFAGFDNVTGSHLNGLQQFLSPEWCQQLLEKHDIELMVKKQDILDTLTEKRIKRTMDLLALSLSEPSGFYGAHPIGKIDHTLTPQNILPDSSFTFTVREENDDPEKMALSGAKYAQPRSEMESSGAAMNSDVRMKTCDALLNVDDNINHGKLSNTVPFSCSKGNNLELESNDRFQGYCIMGSVKRSEKDSTSKLVDGVKEEASVNSSRDGAPSMCYGSALTKSKDNEKKKDSVHITAATTGEEKEDVKKKTSSGPGKATTNNEIISGFNKDGNASSTDTEKNDSSVLVKTETQEVKKRASNGPGKATTDDEGINGFCKDGHVNTIETKKNNSCVKVTTETQEVKKRTSNEPGKATTNDEGINGFCKDGLVNSIETKKNDSSVQVKIETQEVKKRTSNEPGKATTNDEGINGFCKDGLVNSIETKKNDSSVQVKIETQEVNKRTSNEPGKATTNDEGINGFCKDGLVNSIKTKKNDSSVQVKIETQEVKKRTSNEPGKATTNDEGINGFCKDGHVNSIEPKKNDSSVQVKIETQEVKKRTSNEPGKATTNDEGINGFCKDGYLNSIGTKKDDSSVKVKTETQEVKKRTTNEPAKATTNDEGINGFSKDAHRAQVKEVKKKTSNGLVKTVTNDGGQKLVDQNCKANGDTKKKDSCGHVKAEQRGIKRTSSGPVKAEMKDEEVMDVNTEYEPIEKEVLEKAIYSYSKAIKDCPSLNNSELWALHQNRAVVFLKLKRWKNALEDYSHAIKLNPSCYQAYYQRAAAYEELGDKRNAYHDFMSAIHIEQPKTTASAFAHRERLLQSLSEDLAEKSLKSRSTSLFPSVHSLKEYLWEFNYDIFGLFDFTKSWGYENIHFAFQVPLPPAEADANYCDIIKILKKGKLGNLPLLLEKEINCNGKHRSRALLLRATLYIVMAEKQAALKDLLELSTLLLTQDNIFLLLDRCLKLARVQFLLGNRKACFDNLEAARKLKRNNATIYCHKGSYLQSLGCVKEARENYAKAKKLDVDFVAPWINDLSACCTNEGGTRRIYSIPFINEVNSLFREMTRRFRDCPRIWRAYGVLRPNPGQALMSFDEVKKAVSLDPSWPSPYLDIAQAYMVAEKNIGAAKIWFQKAVDVDKRNCLAHHYLGKIASLQGDFELCNKYFQKALSFSTTKSEMILIFKDTEHVKAEERLRHWTL